MTPDEARDILKDIGYPGWTFAIIEHTRGSVNSEFSLVGRFISSVDGFDCTTRKWRLSYFMTKSEVIQTAFKAVITSAEHQAREHFLYRGRAVFGPHFNVDALWDIAEKKDIRS